MADRPAPTKYTLLPAEITQKGAGSSKPSTINPLAGITPTQGTPAKPAPTASASSAQGTPSAQGKT